MLTKRYGKVNRSVLIILLLSTTVGMSVLTDVVSGADSDAVYDVTNNIPNFEDTSQDQGLECTLPITEVFDGNPSQDEGLPQGAPSGGTEYGYGIYKDWGGTWADAEKHPSNTEDDLMCWAATASNVLEWTGWGKVGGMTNTDQMFKYFQDHWTDAGGNGYKGWRWWFDGTEPTSSTGSRVDVPGGNFWPPSSYSYYFYSYFYKSDSDDSKALTNIDNWMHKGYGIYLSIGGHAITCWGFSYDPLNPDYYTGIWVTNSDDDKGDSTPPDMLRYYRLKEDSGRWYLEGYGDGTRYIHRVEGLGVGPGIAPKVNAGKNKYVNEGSTVSFSGSYVNPGSWSSHTRKWEFGDGSTKTTGLNPSHKYGDNGVYTVNLKVTDGQGDVGTDTLTVTVDNVAPNVNAGPDKTGFEGELISFSGSFSDPGFLDTHTIKWDFGDGSTTTGILTPAHTYADNGAYTVALTVTDDDGGVGTDTLTVIVNNVAPTVNAGVDKTADEGSAISFSGSHFDPGILDTHTYSWDFGDGSPSVSGTTVSHIYADNGVYTVTLTVTDNDGGVGTDTLNVTVHNVAPIVPMYSPSHSEENPANEGEEVSFTGTFIDPGTADTHTYSWDFGDGSTTIGVLSTTHTFADNGIFIVTLTVTDDDGGVGTASQGITVNNVAPTVEAGGDQTVDEGDLISFSGSHTDPGTADTHTYSWDFGDGSPSVTGASVTHSYADNGIYTVTLTVTDDDGGVGTDTLTVTVNNVAPAVEIVSFDQSQFFTLEDLTVIMLDTVCFDGTAQDPGSDDLTFTWNYGDSTTDTTTSYINNPPSYPVDIHEIALHKYAEPGNFTVTLTVEDDDGGIGTATLTLTVWGPQDLKQNALFDLDSAMVGTIWIDRRINRSIKFIECSLAEKRWTDATHLDPKYGGSVFCYEFVTVIHLETSFNGYIFSLEKKITRWEAKGYETTTLELRLATILTVKSIFESVIYKLVKADELIVRVAISEAENTLVKTPRFQQKVDRELSKAYEYLTEALGETEDHSKAVLYYWKSWKHSQNAIKWANKEILWHHHKKYHCFKWKK